VPRLALIPNRAGWRHARFAMELGYHVASVRDATAAFGREMTQAARNLNGPTFAHAIPNASELLAMLSPTGGQRLR
jgi:hypothetical protein